MYTLSADVLGSLVQSPGSMLARACKFRHNVCAAVSRAVYSSLHAHGCAHHGLTYASLCWRLFSAPTGASAMDRSAVFVFLMTSTRVTREQGISVL